ncbi:MULTISPECIES: hypothetical protein [Halorussus]|uniref:hypothetical protein n=1 Tax=Halorussus TaxID=1070314 RepID=UPI00209F3BB9|nr:hypothetical protein [Halorussus vallis]USZ77870.1 hypothetical protein NGM07_22065 [Halorussus vallis]
MRRRALLATLAGVPTVALAGCTSPGSVSSGGSSLVGTSPTASLEMTPVRDADLPAKVLYSVDAGGETAALFERILDGGATLERTRPPFPENRHLTYDGTVYRLSHEVTGRTPATRYSVKVDVVQGSVADSETVRFADLPAVDRRAFARHGLADGSTVGVGTTFLYTDAERERSALVPDPAHSVIVWKDGSGAKWVVDDAYETTVNAYRYAAERVAAASEYGRRMRERFAFELADLLDAQRDIVETAVEEGRYVVPADETPPTALVSLADRFRDREQVRGLDEDGEGDLSGPYLVRYAGETYWTILLVGDGAFRTAEGTGETGGTATTTGTATTATSE